MKCQSLVLVSALLVAACAEQDDLAGDVHTVAAGAVRYEAEDAVAESGTATEPCQDVGGGRNVGWIDSGDTLDFVVDVPAAGAYPVTFRVSNGSGAASELVVVDQAGQALGASTRIDFTGGWQTWVDRTGSIQLAAGSQRIRLRAVTGGFNINWFEIAGAGQGGGGTVTRYQAESPVAQNGGVFEACGDEGGGQNIGYINAGQWWDYQVSAPAAGSYPLALRVAGYGGQVHVEDDAGQRIAGPISLPSTNAWQVYATVDATITLRGGSQRIRIVADAAGFNFNWFEIAAGSAPPPPPSSTRYQAESPVAQNGGMFEACGDEGGGQNIGYINAGQWWDYQVSAPAAGSYALALRVAGYGGQVHVEDDAGQRIAGPISLPSTNAWQTYTTVPGSITLRGGSQRIRIVADAAGFNFNWFEIAAGGSPPPPPPPTGVQRPIRRDSTELGASPPYGYYEYLPPAYNDDPARRWPIILFYEGIGERGDGNGDLPRMLSTGLPQVIQNGQFAGSDRFIVLSVQYPDYAYPGQITEMLAWAKAHYRVDTTRMYLTGLSYGAFAAWDYQMTTGDASEFAAIVPISGNDGCSDGSRARHVAIWAFHGEQDGNLPYTPYTASVNSVARVNAAGPDTRALVTIFPDTGHSPQTWNAVYDSSRVNGNVSSTYDPFNQTIYDWMLQHHR